MPPGGRRKPTCGPASPQGHPCPLREPTEGVHRSGLAAWASRVSNGKKRTLGSPSGGGRWTSAQACKGEMSRENTGRGRGCRTASRFPTPGAWKNLRVFLHLAGGSVLGHGREVMAKVQGKRQLLAAGAGRRIATRGWSGHMGSVRC